MKLLVAIALIVLCAQNVNGFRMKRDIPGSNKCTWGPGYWCSKLENAKECGDGALQHCQEKVWLASAPRARRQLGANKCTWGPAYWCDSIDNANECSAMEHCQRVWQGQAPNS